MRVEQSPLKPNVSVASLAPFLGLSYLDPQAFDLAKKQVDRQRDNYPRESLATILREYNQLIGNDSPALENIKKIGEPNSYCVVTGQQLGMMGGPLYTILKGISCLLIAKQTGAIPVFWLATEDHDIPEVDHTYLLDAAGNFKKFHLSLPRDGRAVENIDLTSTNVDQIEEFWNFLKIPPQILPKARDFYSHSMIQLMASLFAGTGMVFVEPKLFRPLAIPFFEKELKECQAIQSILMETTDRLVQAGGNPIIKVGGATNLFLVDEHHKRQKLLFNGKQFSAGKENFTLDELLDKVRKDPQSFSCNVAVRPVLQSTLLPVIAYVGGPSEVDYHRQLGDYHLFHGVEMPRIVPRLSATFIHANAATILASSGLKPWEQLPMHREDVIGKDLHQLRNLIYPHNQPQERVLNWWEFQAKSSENLILECLKQLTWNSQSHHYIYL